MPCNSNNAIIPHYLAIKLASLLKITSPNMINAADMIASEESTINFNHLKSLFSKYYLQYQFNYLQLFCWLKYTFPSLTFKALHDLYCLEHNLALNSLSAQQKSSLKLEYSTNHPSYPPLTNFTINTYMQRAQKQAQLASKKEEVPIGAVIVKDNIIIARGYNNVLNSGDNTNHAEIVAIKAAQQKLANYRLVDCDLYVTIEPCLMCAGAIFNSRMRRLIFGAIEPKTGAFISQYQVGANYRVNHQTEIIGPIDNMRYNKELQQFFATKRILNN